jgi:ABC-type multidrug transport system ATPase subunit
VEQAEVGSKQPQSTRTLSFPFEPVTLAFKDLNYYVPNPAGSGELQLLKKISGAFRPGILTALMGASGAGKTTLMDVLAGPPPTPTLGF